MRLRPPLVLFLFFLLSVSASTWWGCSAPANENTCTLNTDCPTGKRCIRRQCRAVVEVNDPPIAMAKGSQRIRQNSTVSLDGSKSRDPEGGKLSFLWTIKDKPQASKAVLKDAETAKPSIIVDAPGDYIIELIVTDEKKQESRPSRVKLTVYGGDENGKPVANAGIDQVVGINAKVQLDGSSSNDPDKEPITYQWELKSKPAGSAATLDDPKAKKPTFTADKAGKYIVSLVVNDGLSSSTPDSATVEALTDFDLQPELTSVTPSSGFVDTEVQAVLEGSGFSNNAIVIFNGRALPRESVSVKNETRIEAKFSLVGLVAKSYNVLVRNPNAKESKEAKFEVKPLPKPEITKLSPNLGAKGSRLTITVTGKGFVQKSEALFQTTPLKTTYKSETEITFELDLTATVPGVYKVGVRNPGGRAAAPVDFKVLEPGLPPELRVLNPPSAKTGTKIVFSVHGTGFAPGAVILFNGKALPSDRKRRDEIQAVGGLDLAGIAPGKYPVQVRNADGSKSKVETFTVEDKDPTPSLDRVLPFFIYLGGPNKIGFYGQFFAKGSKITIGSNVIDPKDVNFKSSTYIEVNVDTTKGKWVSGDYMAYVESPSGKKSKGFKVSVTYRVPTISSTTPSGWTTKCDTDVNIYGNNFVKSSKVLFTGGASRTYTVGNATNPLTFVNDKHLKLRLKVAGLRATTSYFLVDNGPKARSSRSQFYVQSSSLIPVPQIREVRPSSAPTGTKASVLIYYQSPGFFRNGAIVYLDGKQQKTTCGSSGTTCYSLSAELDLNGLKPGKHQLQVYNPCGVKSKVFDFLVSAPPRPYIARLTPPYASPGDKTQITIQGMNLNKGTKLLWNKKPVALTFKSDKEVVTKTAIDFTGVKVGEIEVQLDNGYKQTSPVVKFPIVAKAAPLLISGVSTSIFDRGKIHSNITVVGTGFTNQTAFFFNSKKLSVKYSSTTQVRLDGLDFTKLPAGTHYLYAQEGTNKSNLYALLAKPLPLPELERINPTSLYVGSTSSYFYVYGKKFCELASSTSRTCVKNPLIKIIDPSGKDVSSLFRATRTYVYSGWTRSSYVYGTFNASSLKAGSYKIYFELPTGERSNPGLLSIKSIPDPIIQRLSPTTMYAGDRISNFYVYATFFCSLNGSRCRTNPRVRILDSAGKDYASNYNITYTYGSSTWSYGYVRGPLDTNKMPAGDYKLTISHPTTGKKSKEFPFSLRKRPAPYLTYINPYYVTEGSSRTHNVYGNYFSSGAYLQIGLQKVPTSYGSTSRVNAVLDGTKLKTGTQSIVLHNPNGQKSGAMSFTVIPKKKGSTPYITRTTAPLYPNNSYTLYVYGHNWQRVNPSFLLNGKALTNRSRCYTTSSTNPYCYLYSFSTANMKPGNYSLTMTQKVGTTTYTSSGFNLVILTPPPPEITSVSPTTISLTSTSTRFRIYGRHFVRGAFATIGTINVPMTYSSATYMYTNISNKTFKAGTYKVKVTNPDKRTSNTFTVTFR